MKKLTLFEGVENVLPEMYKTHNKTEEEVNQDIEIIETWLKTQPHLPETMKNCHIRNFLLMNKFRVERTKEKIDNYYSIRSLMPDFFRASNPKLPNIKHAIKETIYICLHPSLYKGLHRMYLYKLKKGDVVVPLDCIHVVFNIKEVRFHEDYIFNDIHVIDLANFTFGDMIKITPSLLFDFLKIFQDVYSLRFKAYYIFNAPPFFSKLTALLKSSLKPKIFSKVHVSSDDKILEELFTIDTLPKDYGGNGLSLDELTDLTVTKLEEYQNRFDQLDKMRVDENFRPEKLENDEILGYHGCFKKLNID